MAASAAAAHCVTINYTCDHAQGCTRLLWIWVYMCPIAWCTWNYVWKLAKTALCVEKVPRAVCTTFATLLLHFVLVHSLAPILFLHHWKLKNIVCHLPIVIKVNIIDKTSLWRTKNFFYLKMQDELKQLSLPYLIAYTFATLKAKSRIFLVNAFCINCLLPLLCFLHSNVSFMVANATLTNTAAPALINSISSRLLVCQCSTQSHVNANIFSGSTDYLDGWGWVACLVPYLRQYLGEKKSGSTTCQ